MCGKGVAFPATLGARQGAYFRRSRMRGEGALFRRGRMRGEGRTFRRHRMHNEGRTFRRRWMHGKGARSGGAERAARSAPFRGAGNCANNHDAPAAAEPTAPPEL